jgi:hypothetical protein
MTGASYPAAKVVANRLASDVETSLLSFKPSGDASQPGVADIEEIISTAFWASLRREEGKSPKISLAYLSAEQAARPFRIEPSIPFDPEVLAHLAPAVEGPGIHLGVWRYGNELRVWGVTRTLPAGCFVLEVVAPGLLVVKYRRDEPTAKFTNVAVLEGANVKFLELRPARIVGSLQALESLLTFYDSAGQDESDNALVRIAIAMRSHGRGGSLLVVPWNSDSWRSSIVPPVPYSIIQPPNRANSHSAVEALAGLTAVDGATVISDRLEALAFGVKIMPRQDARLIEHVLLTEPMEGAHAMKTNPALLGGTRHLSAAQFVYDQRNSIALVASQDGRFTVFAWSDSDQIVHAHRLESLLI